jgi:CcmD family protein
MNALLEEIYSTIIPSAPYIIAAYALIWVVLLVWVFLQFNKQKKLEQQLLLLEEELDDLKKK